MFLTGEREREVKELFFVFTDWNNSDVFYGSALSGTFVIMAASGEVVKNWTMSSLGALL